MSHSEHQEPQAVGGAAFGELRSVLYGPPSLMAWAELSARVGGLPEGRFAEVEAWLKRGLARWPDPLLMTPMHWVERAMRGQPPPALRLARAVGLYGRHKLEREPLEHLLAGLDRGRVTRVGVHEMEIERPALEALLVWLTEPPAVPLVSLELDKARLGVGGLERLIESGVLEGVEQLALRREPLRWGLGRFEEVTRVAPLKRLDLSDDQLGAEELRALDPIDWLGARELVLSYNPLLAWPARWPGQRELVWRARRLELHDVGLYADELEALLGAIEAPGALTRLGIASNGLGPEAMEALAGAPGLEELVVADNPIGDTGLARLLDSREGPGLVALDISGCQIGDEGARTLARCEALADLDHLRFGRNDIGPEGRRALRASAHLKPSSWRRT